MWSARCGAFGGCSAGLERERGLRPARAALPGLPAGCRWQCEGGSPPFAGGGCEMLLKALEVAEAQLEERGSNAEERRSAEAAAADAEPATPAGVSAETPTTQFTLPPRPDAVPPGVSAETPTTQFTLPPRPDAVPPGVSAETPPAPFTLPPRPDAVPSGVSAETPPRSISQRRADAFEHILGRFLAGKGSGSAAGAHELVVHIAHDALCDVSRKQRRFV